MILILKFFVGTKHSREVGDPVLVYIDGLHRLGNNWNYDEYLIVAQVYHGTRPVGEPNLSKSMQASGSFFKRLIFDCWLVRKRDLQGGVDDFENEG